MSFVQDFQRLFLEKPHYNVKHTMAENCEYSDTALKSKNCYYCFAVYYCEDVFYSRFSRKCTSCYGMSFCANCEWCHECIDCVTCYDADFCQDCHNCRSSKYCKDCFSCQDCFGCVGQYQKQYRMFNEQLSKEEYVKRLAKINVQNLEHRDAIRSRIEELRTRTPNLSFHQFRTEDCLGNHISESKNCIECYDIFSCEDCLYTVEATGIRSSCDITVCLETEWSYQCIQSPLGYNCNFCVHFDNGKNCEFCAFGRNCEDCFGCVGIEKKKFCILNTQYDQEEYQRLTAEIKRELIQSGQYNLGIYFANEYEKHRYRTEDDSALFPIHSPQ